MSTLAQAINFRSLADQLDDAEYQRMIARLLAGSPRGHVMSWLFKQFVTCKAGSFTRALFDNTMDQTTKIIRARKPKQSAPKQNINNQTNICSLSGDSHREIASYLRQKEYFAYAQTNRAIFVGCNSPNSLRHLDLIKVRDYLSVDLSKYAQLTHLKVKLWQLYNLQLPLNGSKICNNLKNLSLCGGQGYDQMIKTDSSMDGRINLSNVVHLRLSNFGSSNKSFVLRHPNGNLNLLRVMLSKLPSVHHLSLDKVFCPPDIADNEMKALLPNLTTFESIRSCRFTFRKFMRLFGDSLHNLRFEFDSALTRRLLHGFFNGDLSFGNLRDLNIVLDGDVQPIMNALDNIFKTAKNLKRVHIQDQPIFDRSNLLSNYWEFLMKKVITKQQTALQYVSLQIIAQRLIHIANGITNKSHLLPNHLAFVLYFHYGSIKCHKIFVSVSRVLDEFLSSGNDKFKLKFVFERWTVVDGDTWNEERLGFMKNYSAYSVDIQISLDDMDTFKIRISRGNAQKIKRKPIE